jgi:hypothetical protein
VRIQQLVGAPFMSSSAASCDGAPTRRVGWRKKTAKMRHTDFRHHLALRYQRFYAQYTRIPNRSHNIGKLHEPEGNQGNAPRRNMVYSIGIDFVSCQFIDHKLWSSKERKNRAHYSHGIHNLIKVRLVQI